MQVNFAENIRELKILGSYPVTVIHKVTTIIYRAVLWGLTVSESGKKNLTWVDSKFTLFFRARRHWKLRINLG